MGNTRTNRILLFAAGGTGGHIYPAIAVADKCIEIDPSIKIEFVGSHGRIEEEIIPREGYKLNLIWISSLQRGFTFRSMMQNFSLPIKMLASFIQAYKLLNRLKPNVVVCAGSAVSLPIGKVAQWKKIQTVLLESNAIPGLSTKKLAINATQIHLAFSDAKKYLKNCNTILSGNPIRKIFFENLDKQNSLSFFGLGNNLTVFVFGGSQGSMAINSAIEKIIDSLQKNGIQLIWQTGKSYLMGDLKNRFMFRSKYIYEMDKAYSASDLVIARAGATTISELSAVGKPSILIPLPTASEDHQKKNAEAFNSIGASEYILDKNLDEQLFDKIIILLKDPNKLKEMSTNALSNAGLRADEKIARSILSIC